MMLRLKCQVRKMTEHVYLSIGGNIGDREANLRAAVTELQALPGVEVTAVSSIYETEPWGNRDQANFNNIAVALTTTLTPLALLATLHAVEQALHRERLIHWGPRTIDLDIVYWGERVLDLPDLQVPHPHAAERNFVLLPVQEIAQDDPAVLTQVQAALAENKDTSWINKVGELVLNND